MIRAQEIVLEVAGMTGENCERCVIDALIGVPGVLAARASHHEGRAVVTADQTRATPAMLRKAIEDAGYAVRDVIFPE